MITRVGDVPQEDAVHVRGGGNLSLRTGRDLKGGVFMLGQGNAEVNAGGRLTNGDSVAQRDTIDLRGTPQYTYTVRTLAALFGLADARLTANARAGAEIEAVFDPMLQGQICQSSGCGFDTHGN